MSDSCTNCKFARAAHTNKPNVSYLCVRFPPVTYPIMEASGMMLTVSLIPEITTTDYWCGEWKAL